MLSNIVSQAGTMNTHGIPNDILTSLSPLMIMLLVPILEHWTYPFLRKKGHPLHHISRIALGFVIMSAAMLYVAFVQHLIYLAPPYHVQISLQTPVYLLIALSEILVVTTGYEYAFSRAPSSMKSIVMSIFLSTVAVGASLAIATSPLTVDPKLTWMYSALSVQSLLAGMLLWICFRE